MMHAVKSSVRMRCVLTVALHGPEQKHLQSLLMQPARRSRTVEISIHRVVRRRIYLFASHNARHVKNGINWKNLKKKKRN